jgi:hypothetical protein
MKKRISKKKIIEALRTEPLTGGMWMSLIDDGQLWTETTVGEARGKCTVCAVGAILREVVAQNATVKEFNDACIFASDHVMSIYDSTIEETLKAKNYMGALSIYFEEMAERSPDGFSITNRQRPALIRFVEKNFPSYVTVDLPEEIVP